MSVKEALKPYYLFGVTLSIDVDVLIATLWVYGFALVHFVLPSRYSQLTQVFGRLLHEKRLREDELRGLREDKLKSIRSFAKFLAEDAA